MSGRVTQHCATVIQQGKGKAAKKTQNFKKDMRGKGEDNDDEYCEEDVENDEDEEKEF